MRLRKTERQFSYKSKDEPVKTGKESFKEIFFFIVLDTAIRSVSERIEQMEDHSKHFQFLYDINQLQDCDKKSREEKCRNLQAILTAENSDVNGVVGNWSKG